MSEERAPLARHLGLTLASLALLGVFALVTCQFCRQFGFPSGPPAALADSEPLLAAYLRAGSPRDPAASGLPDPAAVAEGLAGLRVPWTFSTDADACGLTLEAQEGLTLGFDREGAYLRLRPAAALGRYREFSLRVGRLKPFAGIEPDAVRRYETQPDRILQLLESKNISAETASRLYRERERLLKADAPVYVAQAGTPEFMRLLRQLASGGEVRAEGAAPDGEARTASWPLSGTLAIAGASYAAFDAAAYLYAVHCLSAPAP